MKMENVSVCMDQAATSSIPPVVMATINVQVSLDPKQQKNEIVNIGVLLHHKFHLDKASPKPPFDQHYCCKFIFQSNCCNKPFLFSSIKRPQITYLLRK